MRHLKIGQRITNRNDNSIGKYLVDISKYGLIEPDEEISLSIRIRNGDEAALDKLVKTNLRFVVSVAKQHQYQGLALADLINEGNLGLIKAAQRFDYTRGFKFISFAVWWIRQSIFQAISEQKRMVRLPGNQLVGLSKVIQASQQLEQELERAPTTTEIADKLGLPEERITDLIDNSPLSVSLNEYASEESDRTLLDILTNDDSLLPDEPLMRESVKLKVNALLSMLPNRQQLIMKYYHGLDNTPVLTMDDIAMKLNLSKERVRQLRYNAYRTLSEMCTNATIQDYL